MRLIPHDFTVVAEVPAAASPPMLQGSIFCRFSWKYRFLVFSVFVLLLVDFPEWSCLGLLVSSLLGSSLLKGRKSWWPLFGDVGVVSVISFWLVRSRSGHASISLWWNISLSHSVFRELDVTKCWREEIPRCWNLCLLWIPKYLHSNQIDYLKPIMNNIRFNSCCVFVYCNVLQ